MFKGLTGKAQETYSTIKSLYEKNNFLKVSPQEVPKIPKIIHQIWLGTREISEEREACRQNWMKYHPNWEYRLWTDKEVANYDFVDKNNEHLFHKSIRIGEKVNILRYDILNQLGGLYVDIDYDCFQAFDLLNESYDFYAGLLSTVPQKYLEEQIIVQNAVVGAKPDHPIIKLIGQLLMDQWDGSPYPDDLIYTTLYRTYAVLTLAISDGADLNGNTDIILPGSFLYPDNYMPSY
ncbi:MAG: glycosyltransferase [Desulfosporosinus sp.]|nr:glycosyltransferase [Desulfosporosinus sp.]